MINREKNFKFTYQHARKLYRAAQKTPEELFKALKSSYEGLSAKEAQERLKIFGENVSDEYKKKTSLRILIQTIKNPVIYFIGILALCSYLIGSIQAAVFMGIVLLASVISTFIHDMHFTHVVHKLLATSRPNVHVIRNNGNSHKDLLPTQEISIKELVPGDIIRISAGDIVPADIRLLSAKNLLVNQSVLTGETVPIDKNAEFDDALLKNLPELKNICFLGSSVVNGNGVGIVFYTGKEAYVNSLTKKLEKTKKNNFENGIRHFILLSLKSMIITIPFVFIIHFFISQSWTNAFLFAMTMAVSLTSKSLPFTISSNLNKAALSMLKKRIIVKRLNAIQNLGAMDILCADKTGTLTEDFSEFGGAFDTLDQPDKEVLTYAYLNSHFQIGLKNHLDFALIKHAQKIQLDNILENYSYLDEIAFDSSRKRISVLIRRKNEKTILICKGALEEILPLCSSVQNDASRDEIEKRKNVSYISMAQRMNELNIQAVAVAYKIMPDSQLNCQLSDEVHLTLCGYITFLDPPVKKNLLHTFKVLKQYGVSLKILTGDNHWDAIKVANEIGLEHKKIMLGTQLDSLNEQELNLAVEKISIFAKLSPDHKERIIHAYQNTGHTVGYLGDGVNDVSALFAADVGISVNNAVSTAKEFSNIILLDKNISSLIEGIIEGRKAFIKIKKYIKMHAVTKFSFVLSMLGASIALPFLPLKPTQMILQNIIFGLSQAGVPQDKISEQYLLNPSQWEFTEIEKFKFYFAPVLTLFDFATFSLMWFYFGTKLVDSQGLFQSAWFIESLFTQGLIIHLFSAEKITLKSIRPSYLTTIFGLALGIYLPFSPVAKFLGFNPLPASFFIWMTGIVCAYCLLTAVLKMLLKKGLSLRI